MLTFEYITRNGSVAFSEDSDFWISDIDSLSSNEISISETQGTGRSAPPALHSPFSPVTSRSRACCSAISRQTAGHCWRV